MNKAFQIAIAVLLVVIVAAVLISPAVDLEPTALRAAMWIAALFASFAVVRVVFAVPTLQSCKRIRREYRVTLYRRCSPSVLDLYGAMLC